MRGKFWIRKSFADLKKLGFPFTLRAKFARLQGKLRFYFSDNDEYTFVRYEGGCMDPQCNCGASMVYSTDLVIRRNRVRDGKKVKTERIKKALIWISEFGTPEKFEWATD